MSQLIFKQLNPCVKMPIYSSDDAAAFDVHSPCVIYLPPAQGRVGGGVATIKLGFAAAIPRGCGGLMLPRSSTGTNGLMLANTGGLIDSDYRGEWIAKVRNIDPRHSIEINEGDRILQVVIVPVLKLGMHLLEAGEELPETYRGDGGFGSTGK